MILVQEMCLANVTLGTLPLSNFRKQSFTPASQGSGSGECGMNQS